MDIILEVWFKFVGDLHDDDAGYDTELRFKDVDDSVWMTIDNDELHAFIIGKSELVRLLKALGE